MRWFIGKKADSKVFLTNDTDFGIVERVYNTLNDDWKTGRLGNPEACCLKERMNVAKTLNVMHEYLEKSRALYSIGANA